MANLTDVRLDLLLMENGLFHSRTEAQRAIARGSVTVNGIVVDRPNRRFPNCSSILVNDDCRAKYVSRGGEKLEAALEAFSITPVGRRCLDIGISTGGFTDCLLQAGAEHVVGIDVGHKQLHWKLQDDPRIELREGVNARSLTPSLFGNKFSVVTIDVSFISVNLIVPLIAPLLLPNGFFICLIKPQFEVGAGNLGKNGVVTDRAKREAARAAVHQTALAAGFLLHGSIESPITGGEGNVEYLSVFTLPEDIQLH